MFIRQRKAIEVTFEEYSKHSDPFLSDYFRELDYSKIPKDIGLLEESRLINSVEFTSNPENYKYFRNTNEISTVFIGSKEAIDAFEKMRQTAYKTK